MAAVFIEGVGIGFEKEGDQEPSSLSGESRTMTLEMENDHFFIP